MQNIFDCKGGGTNNLISLDTETLSKWSDAVVLSIGVTGGDITIPTTFEQLLERGSFIKLDSREQKRLGRITSADTVAWWKTQNKENIIKSFLPSDNDILITTLKELLAQKFVDLCGEGNRVYADRNLFDFSKLQHMFEETLKTEIPWDYHNLNDFSTMFKSWGVGRYATIFPNDIPPRFGFMYHDPLHDAALDWLRTQHALVKIGVLDFGDSYRFNGLFYEKI
jgi:hypothetical protein